MPGRLPAGTLANVRIGHFVARGFLQRRAELSKGYGRLHEGRRRRKALTPASLGAMLTCSFLTTFSCDRADDRTTNKGDLPEKQLLNSFVADETPKVTLNMRNSRRQLFRSAITAPLLAILDISMVLIRVKGFVRVLPKYRPQSIKVLTKKKSRSTNYRRIRPRERHSVL